jgi:hypothetical protein
MILGTYYGPAELDTEHGTMVVNADLTIDVDTAHSMARPDHAYPSGPRSWSGSVDNSLGGPVHPVDLGPATLRMPDGREGAVHIHGMRALMNEPVTWTIQGEGPAPFGNTDAVIETMMCPEH